MPWTEPRTLIEECQLLEDERYNIKFMLDKLVGRWGKVLSTTTEAEPTLKQVKKCRCCSGVASSGFPNAQPAKHQ